MTVRFTTSNIPSSFTPLITKGPEDEDTPPAVYFTNEVMRAIEFIVQRSKNEVAWLGTAKELDSGDYLVDRIFIPDQTVGPASVDIESDAIGKLVNELMDQGIDPNALRYHGHSHVDMNVDPSTVDDNHMAEYLETTDWFIRSIHNKKGDARVDVFDKTSGYVANCVDYDVWEHLLDDSFYAEILSNLEAKVTSPPRISKGKRSSVKPLLAQQGLNAQTYADRDSRRLQDMIDQIDDEETYYESLIDSTFRRY